MPDLPSLFSHFEERIILDYELFTPIVRRQWVQIFNDSNGHFPFTVDECMYVFRYFFDTYHRVKGEDHPPLKAGYIRSIMEKMPYIETSFDEIVELTTDDYRAMIESYFKTFFANCDYRISHFFSGHIREMRYYECI